MSRHVATQVYEDESRLTSHRGSVNGDECGSVSSYGHKHEHKTAAECFRPPTRQTDEVLVIILFGSSYYNRFRNSVIRERSIIKNYGGQIVGISAETTVEEGNWPKDKAMGLLKFRSLKDARMWSVCDPICKQQDWLDSVDVVVIPLYQPMNPIRDDNRVFIELVDVGVQDADTFYKGYLGPAISILAETKGKNISNCESGETVKFRGLWEPGHVIIHQWDNHTDFRCFYDSDAYRDYKKCRQSATESSVITCELVAVMQ
ncbi:uncharacterized protein LOC141911367 [Tubulanus polymorphus]|uniref:uncharacterized protein LOC141911367 n=1 Tax=Tubulanus polymorphus TaxID=672921 RepID=UPI003DA3FA3C